MNMPIKMKIKMAMTKITMAMKMKTEMNINMWTALVMPAMAMTLGMMSGFEEGLVAGFVNGMMGLESVLMPAFNQESELMCDLHGVDLAEYAGYDGCAARNFWLRMDDTGEFDFERLLYTHPGGDDRADCIHHHIGHFYNLPCN